MRYHFQIKSIFASKEKHTKSAYEVALNAVHLCKTWSLNNLIDTQQYC
jgi:hypothetical protein